MFRPTWPPSTSITALHSHNLRYILPILLVHKSMCLATTKHPIHRISSIFLYILNWGLLNKDPTMFQIPYRHILSLSKGGRRSCIGAWTRLGLKGLRHGCPLFNLTTFRWTERYFSFSPRNIIGGVVRLAASFPGKAVRTLSLLR